MNHKLVRSSQKDLTRQIPPQFTAQRTLDSDGLKWKLFPARWHVATASLALHDEGLAAIGCWEHAEII